MMTAFLIFKTKIKDFYEKYYKILRAFLKFIVALGLFTTIFNDIPFYEGIEAYKVPLVLIIAVICACVPDMVIMVLVAFAVIGEIASFNLIVGILFASILCIYFLLFGRYTTKQSYIVLLIPMLSVFHISFAVPIIAALFLGPAMIPATIVGVFVQYVLIAIKEYYLIAQSAVDTGNTMEGLQYVIRYIVASREMLVYMATFTVTFAFVYFVRKCKFNYASHVGIFVGLILCMVGGMSQDILWSENVDLNQLLWSIAFTAIICYVVQFFRMSLDYTGVRKLQFEDDEYYYYVKAVPKLKVTVKDKTVTRIQEETETENVDLKDEIEKVLEEDFNSMDDNF